MSSITPTDLSVSPYRYPIALNLHGKRCVVVGAGSVGTRKADGLRVAGADVVVLSLETTGAFVPAQLDEAFLVIAATDNKAVNNAIIAAAQARGILCNNAAPEEDTDAENHFGDFVTMAQISDGDLLIGITTGGAGPSVTAKIRESIEAALGSGWGDFLTLYRQIRMRAKAKIADRAIRVARLRELAENPYVWQLVKAREYEKAREEAEKCLL
jgi:precorrin-2 dehydrogenase / sirohydrochlorin ferrochelatase